MNPLQRTVYATGGTGVHALWLTQFDPQQNLNRELFIQDNALYVSSWHIKKMTPYEFQDSYLYTLDVHTGQITWQSPMINGWIFHIAIDDNGHIYCGAQNSTFSAFDPKTNQQLWQYPINDGNVYATPIIHNNVVYIAQSGYDSDHMYVAALNATTGTPRWSTQLPDSKGFSNLEPLALSNDIFYVATAEGVQTFSTSIGNKIMTVPATTLVGDGSGVGVMGGLMMMLVMVVV